MIFLRMRSNLLARLVRCRLPRSAVLLADAVFPVLPDVPALLSRYEETEYQTVAIARLQEILDAIGIKALVTLSA